MILIAKSVVPLAAGGIWDSGEWAGSGNLNKDTQGEVLAVASAYSDQPGTLQILQSDDPSNSKMILPGGDSVVCPALQVATIQVPVTHAFWLAVFKNNQNTAQTVFEGIAWQSNDLLPAILLELKKLRFDLNSVTGIDKTADNQPAGSF